MKKSVRKENALPSPSPLYTLPQEASDLRWFHLRWFPLWLPDFTVVRKWYTLSGNHTLNSAFCSFSQAGDMWRYRDALSWYCSVAASCGSQVATDRDSQQLIHPYNYPVHLQPCCFPLSVHYLINYMRYATLYFKIGFCVRWFYPTIANVSVLSISGSLGWAMMFGSRCIQCIFNLEYFQLLMSSLGHNPILSRGKSVLCLVMLWASL